MASVNITSELLKELLSQAYEAGWYGSLELKEGAVSELLERAIAEQPPQPTITLPQVEVFDSVVTGRVTIDVPNVVPESIVISSPEFLGSQ